MEEDTHVSLTINTLIDQFNIYFHIIEEFIKIKWNKYILFVIDQNYFKDLDCAKEEHLEAG